MSKHFKIWFMSLAALAVVALTWLFLVPNTPKPDNKTAKTVQPPLAQTSQSPLLEKNANEQIHPKDFLARFGSELQLAFDTSKRLKDFVEKADANPSQGSYFYATRVTNLCGLIMQIAPIAKVSSTSSDDPRAQQARQTLESKCQGITSKDIASEPVLKRLGAEKGDLVLGTMGADDSTKSILSKRNELLNLVFTLSDTNLLAEALAMMSLPGVSKEIVFNGQPVNAMPAADAKAFQIALNLVACDLGKNCGRESLEMQFYCATGACNHDSLDALIKAREASVAGSRLDWNQVTSFRKTLANSISQGNKSAITWIDRSNRG
jgi:hypothetical protein